MEVSTALVFFCHCAHNMHRQMEVISIFSFLVLDGEQKDTEAAGRHYLWCIQTMLQADMAYQCIVQHPVSAR